MHRKGKPFYKANELMNRDILIIIIVHYGYETSQLHISAIVSKLHFQHLYCLWSIFSITHCLLVYPLKHYEGSESYE